jgi:hypothetical protein
MKIKKIFFIFIFFSIISLPFFAGAQVNIWAGTGDAKGTCNQLGYNCTLCDGITVTGNIITFLLQIGVVLAVGVILYGAIRLITSGGSEKQISEAKGIIKSSLIGLVLVMGAWLIVDTVFKVLTDKDSWNQIDPIGCKKSKLEIFSNIGTNNGNGTENNATKKEDYFSAPAPTPEESWALDNLTEGKEVTPISECSGKPTTGKGENIIQYAFSTPKNVRASYSGDLVIGFAKKYLGKLLYSNDPKARRDPDGKTTECKNLIKGTKYTGCSDCSGFAFKMFTCVLGEDIGQKVDDQTEYVNSAIIGTAVLPSGFKRYFTEDMQTGEEVAAVLARGDVLGYDVTCNKKYNKKAKMGHVMIFDKLVYQNDEWFIQMIDQGYDGGSRIQLMDETKEKPFLHCGYIIHIVE